MANTIITAIPNGKPGEGLERSAFTAVSTIVSGVGFAAILLSVIILGEFGLDVRKGLLWGAAGFASFVAAPALGMLPVPPGVPVADVGARQLWWVMTVGFTALGLGLIVKSAQAGRARHQRARNSPTPPCRSVSVVRVFLSAQGPVRSTDWTGTTLAPVSVVRVFLRNHQRWSLSAGGAALLLLPHAIGAPQITGPQVVPAHLVRDFAVVSIVGNGLFWIALGAMTGWLYPVRRDATPI